MSNSTNESPCSTQADHPRFALGQLVATPGALSTLAENGMSAYALLTRHQSGDWGSVSSCDATANDRALTDGGRLLSRYEIAPGVVLWVITEWDRSATTILLPSEY